MSDHWSQEETPEGAHLVREGLAEFIEKEHYGDPKVTISEIQLGVIQFAGASSACGVKEGQAGHQLEWAIKNFVLAYKATLQASGSGVEIDVAFGDEDIPDKDEMN